jgi:hypothetical protein
VDHAIVIREREDLPSRRASPYVSFQRHGTKRIIRDHVVANREASGFFERLHDLSTAIVSAAYDDELKPIPRIADVSQGLQ